MKTKVHRNSLAAYETGRIDRFPQRARNILALFERKRIPMTDRAVMIGLGHFDMNAVRPRITELVEAGVLIEVSTTIDPETKKTVRVVDLAKRAGTQTALPI
jgi:hypothetical protein